MFTSIARNVLFVGLVLGGLGTLGANLFPPGVPPREVAVDRGQADTILQAAAKVDAAFQSQWASQQPAIRPVGLAEPLAVARRLSLALTGSIPSLEEIRWYEGALASQHLPMQGSAATAAHAEQLWLANLLDQKDDRRFADYFAERLARAFVGTENGPFLLYRRRRFVAWLGDRLHEGKPYDDTVRSMITGDGLWTDHPGTNFLTVTIESDNGKDRPNAERLAGRVSRAFLGIRLDCAHCHDHPFERWKQSDFEGLAAFFGQSKMKFTGLRDDADQEYEFENPRDGEKHKPKPAVPVMQELLPEVVEGSRRESLATWVTHPKNTYFARVTVNRVWALMFGRALVEPVDDISTVLSNGGTLPPALDVLADDFVANGHDIKRLVKVIAASEAFRLESAAGMLNDADMQALWSWAQPRLSGPSGDKSAEESAMNVSSDGSTSPLKSLRRLVEAARANGRLPADGNLFADLSRTDFAALVATLSPETQAMLGELRIDQQPAALLLWLEQDLADRHQESWAVFPLTRLRPDQVIGALLQASTIKTLDQQSHILFRLQKFGQTNEFVERYGDAGEEELDRRGGTIPQRLLMLNGDLVQEHTKQDLMTASSRIGQLAAEDGHAVETAYLAALSRRPSPDELEHFKERLRDTRRRSRGEAMEDLFWTLLNSTEFSWNH